MLHTSVDQKQVLQFIVQVAGSVYSFFSMCCNLLLKRASNLFAEINRQTTGVVAFTVPLLKPLYHQTQYINEKTIPFHRIIMPACDECL